MPDFSSFIKLGNKEAIIASLKDIEGEMQQNVINKMKAGGKEVKEALRASLPQGSGQASSPGSMPYSQTGDLVSKIQATVMPLMLNEPVTLKVYVTQKGFYGRMLEFGTSKMSARPWFYSGVAKFFPFLREKIEEAKNVVIARRNARKRTT